MQIIDISETNFIKTYCENDYRVNYVRTVLDLFSFARETGAREIFIGGSFITDKRNPNDLDVLLAYNLNEDIPRFAKYLMQTAIEVDIQYAAYEYQDVLDSYVFMFAHSRDGVPRPVVRIPIAGREPYQAGSFDENKLKSIKEMYSNRYIVPRSHHKGILVSVHGLYSIGEWNADIAPIVSSQGWIFAPYTYTGNDMRLLFSPGKRNITVEHFREWVYDICQRYSSLTPNLSIIAHSYGTYIVGKYLMGFPELPVDLNAIILTGSVLNRKYDWDSHFAAARIGSVLNIYSPNDGVIKWMPDGKWKRRLRVDPLFGSAGFRGFVSNHPRLMQKKLSILEHNNGINRDVIETIWMPFLNNNSNARQVNEAEMMRKRSAEGE